MIRKIVSIDEEKCNGCGLCVTACHEGALQIIDGKARLVSESYCDGLGACLPECPMGAINIIEREAAEFDEAAVMKRMEEMRSKGGAAHDKGGHNENRHSTGSGQGHNMGVDDLPCGCPGSMAKSIQRHPEVVHSYTPEARESQLRQWPCQIKLVPVNAPYFNNANLLIAADCTSYAYAGFHEDFMRGKITLIGCPKLDDVDYSEKLTAILKANNIKSITVIRMEVPCCGGIVNAVVDALARSGKIIPWNVVTIGTDGSILDS